MRVSALSALLLLAACNGDDDARAPGATLKIDVIGEFDAKASRTVIGGPRDVLMNATQVGLVDFDADGRVIPGLATSWRVSDDGLSYIFRLRDARWEDDRAVTSGDIVAVLRRVVAPDSHHPLKAILRRIENAPEVMAGKKPPKALGVHDPLPNIVEIRLSSPQPQFLQMLAHSSMAIIRKGEFPPAAGAFRVTDSEGVPIRLAANRLYYDASAVALSAIELTPVPEAVEAVGRFRRGATDVVTGGTIAGLTEAQSVPVPQALRIETTYGVYGYQVNVAKGATKDVRVRRALSIAIDRTALVLEQLDLPAVVPVEGLVPPNLPSYGAPPAPSWINLPVEARRNEARALLAEAGYNLDRPLDIEISLPAAREHAAIAAAVSQDWAAIGVRTRTVTRSAAAHAKALTGNDYQLALIERLSPVDSGFFFLSPYSCAAKTAGYCSKEADRLLDATRTMPDLDPRRNTLQSAEALIAAEQPAIMLFTPVRWSLVHPRVSGWADNISGARPLSRLDVLPQDMGDDK
ncbi:peptide ABC transporter substrate-binding protein [Sphingoaurantiacus capsulatus]|uniref:Peptide ABC transporter substrate-binding protein n=1 Tax=Sphingoaurantiacus capsulatus TaxID=1771310 RepID=A0ABV7XCR2_9SPHN